MQSSNGKMVKKLMLRKMIKMTQNNLDGGVVSKATVSQIKNEQKVRRIVKSAKKHHETDELAQRRLGGDRISSKTLAFHESKDSRKKASKRRQRKIAEERSQRTEQMTL